MHGAGPACLFIYSQPGPWLHSDGNRGMPGEEKLLGERSSLGCRAGSGEHPSDIQLDHSSRQVQASSRDQFVVLMEFVLGRLNTSPQTGWFPSPACPQMPPPSCSPCTHPPPSRATVTHPRGMHRASHTQLLPTQFQSRSAGVSRALFSSARLLLWS